MNEKYIELETYRKKNINAYLTPMDANDKTDMSKNLYGEPMPGQEDAAHKGKRHTVRVRIDDLSDGKYQYKEAGGADFNKSRYGWIRLEGGQIVDQS